MQESARSLRKELRQDQTDVAYLVLFHALAKACFETGWSPATANNLIAQICANLGATSGFIAIQERNTLEVLASSGESYPQAARIPLIGKLTSLLKAPCHFDLHHQLQAISPQRQNNTSNTFTLPIAFKSQPIGILVLATPFASMREGQIKFCETICGWLGVILQKNNAVNSNQIDLSVIDALTPREREVFALLPSGKSNAELGRLLGIASGTVKIHVERILSKLGLNDRTQAAVKAVELGYSSSDNLAR